MKSGEFIAYYRVSTKRQGASGLGLDAQKKAVLDYLNGGPWKIIGEFTEVESGKRNDRPELDKALALAKQTGATLILAKMDRLGRCAWYVLKLLAESSVHFVFVEMPNADTFAIGIRAVVAQEEGRAISERTKAALAAAKRRGVKLGTDRPGLIEKIKAPALARARNLAPTIATIREGGALTVRAICDELNRRGIPSPRGARWHVPAVFRLLRLMDGRRRRRAKRGTRAARKSSTPPA